MIIIEKEIWVLRSKFDIFIVSGSRFTDQDCVLDCFKIYIHEFRTGWLCPLSLSFTTCPGDTHIRHRTSVSNCWSPTWTFSRNRQPSNLHNSTVLCAVSKDLVWRLVCIYFVLFFLLSFLRIIFFWNNGTMGHIHNSWNLR